MTRVLVTLVLLAAVAAATAHAGPVVVAEVPFNVRPSGAPDSVAIPVDGTDLACVFSYTAVGGTNEDWVAVVQVDDASAGGDPQSKVSCTFTRPNEPSYLFFNTFSASVQGSAVATAQVFDNEGALLQGEAYDLSADGDVVQGPSFEGLISRLEIANW